MKHIKAYQVYLVKESSNYILPASTGDSDKDEEIFLFSTEDENKSIILNMFVDKLSTTKIFGKQEDIQWTNMYCNHKAGSSVVTYTLEFYTPDENIKKQTGGSVDGHEWMMIADVPSDIISKINSGEISIEDGEKEIKSKISWYYKDGLDKSIGGWQIKSIDSFKQREDWLAKEKAKDEQNPKWIQKFSNWLTKNFA